MKTYIIEGETNPYIAQRDINFKGKCIVTLKRGMTLKEAQKELLEMFNEDYGTGYKNWGHARQKEPFKTTTWNTGERRYEFDSRTYTIVKELPF